MARLTCYDPEEDTDHWMEIDVTESVQHWVDNPSENYGVVLKAYMCNFQTATYTFPSSEALGVDARPQIVISYTTAPPTAYTNQYGHADQYANDHRHAHCDGHEDGYGLAHADGDYHRDGYFHYRRRAGAGLA